MIGILKKIKRHDLNDSELAYETGIHLGDGHLGLYGKKSTYRIVYAGNSVEDVFFFIDVLIPLINKLYGLNAVIIKEYGKNGIRIVIYSKELFEFKKRLGLPVGQKIGIDKIPEFISKNQSNRLSFIAGIFDTDGCIKFLKKHKKINYYPQVRIRMKPLIILEFIRMILISLKISSTLCEEHEIDKRNNKTYQRWCLDVNGKHNVDLFFMYVKPRNLRHTTKYFLWKKQGFCEPRIDIYKRLEIIRSMGRGPVA